MSIQCTSQQEVERWFDGESANSEEIKGHLKQCEACQAHVDFLRETRVAMEALPHSPEIAEAQLPAFLEGIAQEVHQPRRRFTGIWAMASGVAAALIAAVSVLSMLTPPASPVGAQTVIETYSTDIDGATVVLLGDENETPTVWLNAPDDGEI